MESEWTPERLRALDIAVAEARGWTGIKVRAGRPIGWDPGEVQMPGLECVVPPVASVGCKDTLDIQEEEKIDVEYVVGYGWTSEMLEDWYPTPAVVIGLAYLAAKGRPFEG